MKACGSSTPGDKGIISRPEKQSPFVSIIIPTLNEAENIRAQIDALSGLPNIEVIFSDGGSTDGTVRILEKCVDRLPNVYMIQSYRGRGDHRCPGPGDLPGQRRRQ